MNEAETRALSRQGQEAWNDWAQRQLNSSFDEERTARFDNWTNNDVRDFSEFIFPGPVVLAGTFPASVDFSGAIFHGELRCRGRVHFRGASRFTRATFEQRVDFSNATFDKTAHFGGVVFRRGTSFSGTKFKQDTFFCPSNIPEPSTDDLKNEETLGSYISQCIDQHIWTEFHKEADFSHATFHSEVRFTHATFLKPATFERAKFKNDALFSWDVRRVRKINDYGEEVLPLPSTATEFQNGVTFRHAEFKMDAWFRDAKFANHASFIDADFCENANFRYAEFRGLTQFRRTNFKFANFQTAQFLPRPPSKSLQMASKDHRRRGTVEHTPTSTASSDRKDGAIFRGATFQSVATFEDAIFKVDTNFQGCVVHTFFEMMSDVHPYPPDFTQAKFLEGLNFGDARWPEALSTRRGSSLPFVGRRSKESECSNENGSMTSRWRALKRLAVQGRDHHNARLFYREEMLGMLEDRRKRATTENPGWKERMGALDPIRHLYSWFSDFGCSIGRPVLWWTGVAVVCWMALFGLTGWNPDCLSNGLALSVKHSLPVFSSGFEVETRCSCPDLHSYSAVLLGAVQNVLSATFIFLFLLGLRNRFRM